MTSADPSPVQQARSQRRPDRRRAGRPAAAGGRPRVGGAAIVLRRLTMAPQTRAQLADDLRSRDVPDDVAERVLDRFSEVGLVDDEAFAQAWVQLAAHRPGTGAAGAHPRAATSRASTTRRSQRRSRPSAPTTSGQLRATWSARRLSGKQRPSEWRPGCVAWPACSPGRAIRRGMAMAVVREALAAEASIRVRDRVRCRRPACRLLDHGRRPVIASEV